MTDVLVLACVVIVGMISITDLRKGFYSGLITGFLQDPLRKLMPGMPVYYTVLVGVIVAMTFIGAKLRGIPLGFRPIHAWSRNLRAPLKLFIVLVVIQSAVTFINTDSLVLSGIGLLVYLCPLPALLLAYYFAWDKADIFNFFKWYIILSILMLSGVYLAHFGYDWRVLRSVGEALRIYTNTGIGYVDLPAGFFRAPETAAWHGGAAICLLVVLVVSKPGKGLKWLAGFSITFILIAIIFTGRRKIILEIVLFISMYWWLLSYFQRGGTKLANLALLLAFAGWILVTQTDVGSSTLFTELTPYFKRQVGLRQGMVDRLLGNSVYAFQWVIAQNGFFGSGAGSGSQGAQYYGGGDQLIGSAAEGGFGKVLAELGVPGFILFLVMLYSLARYLWRVLVFMKGGDPALARLVYGMTAFLCANGIVFVTAHQVFGDPFVLLMLGWLVGFVIAAPRIQKKIVLRLNSGQ